VNSVAFTIMGHMNAGGSLCGTWALNYVLHKFLTKVSSSLKNKLIRKLARKKLALQS
jgi:hypothetical protein